VNLFDPRVVLDWDFQHPSGQKPTWYRATNELGTVFITTDYAEAVRWLN
jgi:hypothetical protein